MDEVSYFGLREHGVTRVIRLHPGKDPALESELSPRLDLHAHSPWVLVGYGGPAQLALALLADHLGDDAAALRQYQLLKFVVVARLPQKTWILSEQDIRNALQGPRRTRRTLPSAVRIQQ